MLFLHVDSIPVLDSEARASDRLPGPESDPASAHCGRLGLGGTAHRTALGADAGRAAAETAEPIHAGNHASLPRLKQVCQLLCAPATTAMDEAQPLRRLLAAGKGELGCGGHRYGITVHVHRHDVRVSARRLDLAGNRLIRFMQAVADVFRRCSFGSRADEIGRMLTAVARSPVVAGEQIVPLPEPRRAGPGNARRAADKARAVDAIKAIRSKTRARQREKGISGNLPRDFPKVDLSRIGPADMDWSGIDLSRLDLSGTSLKRFNLAGANLQESLLYFTDLSGADLAGADLSGARTCKTKLTGANLIGARLAKMHLDRGDFRHANCAGADFSTVLVERAYALDFTDACLVGASFSRQYLAYTNFARADLTRANLSHTILSDTRLEGARLADACLDRSFLTLHPLVNVDLRGASLRGVYVERGEWLKSAVDAGARDIELQVASLSIVDTQEHYLNHRANGTSLQKCIDAIGDDQVKVRLMRQLVDALMLARNAPMSGTAPALRDIYLSMLDVLAGNPLYAREDAQIAELVAACCEREVQRYDTKLLVEPLPEGVLIRFMEEALRQLGTSGAARGSGLGIMQLVFRARTECKDPRALDVAERLTTCWLDALPGPLQDATKQASELAGEALFPLVCRETGAAIMVSEGYFANRFLERKLGGEFPDARWDMLWEFQPDNAGPRAIPVGQARDVGAALRPFKPLSDIYERRDCAKSRPQLIKAMGLEPFAPLFLAAMQAGKGKKNLTASAQQQRLSACLAGNSAGNWVDGQVTDEHVAALVDVYPRLPMRDDPRAVAYFLLCLSAMITKLSSSQYFGTELESPLALRGYAGALLNKACALAPGLVPNAISADWKNRLFGLHKAFDCTAILSGMMLQRLAFMARGHESFQAIHRSLLPAVWQ
ncbi:pentapeptide repeat-containing protein [Cupriavidus respiraculi]|uniref:E3 ubiquitin-protein ligase SopA-like catalytic domain-containing protein n=1 Tax=Cupriavidus respiraculi TaxID=195930 RepID=A0ABM8WDY3_9BURK|nr:hypothetical protein LMG21510_00026 [Cupriavidus respiraculi]